MPSPRWRMVRRVGFVLTVAGAAPLLLTIAGGGSDNPIGLGLWFAAVGLPGLFLVLLAFCFTEDDRRGGGA